MDIHHYEVTTSSGKTTGDGSDDYSHKIEVNSDAKRGAQTCLIGSLNKDYKIERDQLNY